MLFFSVHQHSMTRWFFIVASDSAWLHDIRRLIFLPVTGQQSVAGGCVGSFVWQTPHHGYVYTDFSVHNSVCSYAVRCGANRLVSVNFLPAVKTVAVVKNEIPAFPQGQRDAPLCGFVGLNGGNFLRSFVRHFVKSGFRRHDAWLPCMRHSPERSDAYTRHRIQHHKKPFMQRRATNPQPLRGISGI